MRDTHRTLCMLLGWQRICSLSKRISVVRNMGDSCGLKGKGVDLSQRSPKRKRDLVQIPAVIETPLVHAENAPSSSGWRSNVAFLLNFMMSFLCTVFSWAFPWKDIVRTPATIVRIPSCAFPSYLLKFDFSFAFLNFVCACVDNFP